MANPFAFFDTAYPFPIHLIKGTTEGHYDNTTNVFVPGTQVDTAITGHFASYGGSERGRFETEWKETQAGVIETGVRRFFTSADVEKGDIIEAYLDSGGTKRERMRVVAIAFTQRLMTAKLGYPLRRECLLKEEPA